MTGDEKQKSPPTERLPKAGFISLLQNKDAEPVPVKPKTERRLERAAANEVLRKGSGSNFITLRDFIEQHRGESLTTLTEKYPEPVLIQTNDQNGEKGPLFHTEAGTRTTESINLELLDRPLYFLKRKKTSLFENMITVGRTRNNDIVIDCTFVSKFHAYFTQQQGDWMLADANSTNGTRAQGFALEAEKPRALQFGDEVSFGDSLVFQFIEVRSLYDFFFDLA